MKKILITIITVIASAVRAMADTAPVYPGGDAAIQEYIAANMQYPVNAMENGIEGVVSLECRILPDGSVGKVKVVRMVDPDLEAEALRLVKKMPAWRPAEEDGKAVEATVTVAVTFTLPE